MKSTTHFSGSDGSFWKKDLNFYRKREIDTKLDNGEELTDEEVEEQGYLESWRKLEGKNIKQGEVKLQAGLFT